MPTMTRMAKQFGIAMNSINQDLKFTVETEIDYKEKRLPTLDFYMWYQNGLIHHSYFEKRENSNHPDEEKLYGY